MSESRMQAAVLSALLVFSPLLHAAEPDEVWPALNRRTAELVHAGKYEEAFTHAQKVVAQARARLGFEHLTTAKAMNNLANLYAARGNTAAARDLYEKVLKIETAQLGDEAPVAADTLVNLARLHLMNKDASGAKPLLEKALRIKTKDTPADTEEAAKIRSLLAEAQTV